jgi:serine/threonine-protein kinase PpkA
MLAARKPFVARDAFAVALMHANQPPPPLPDSVKAYQALVDRLLAKDPSQRFATAEELLHAIDTLDAQLTVDASTVEVKGGRPSLEERARRPPERHIAARSRPLRKWSMSAAGIALVAAAGIYFYPTLAPYHEQNTSIPDSPLPTGAGETAKSLVPSGAQTSELNPSTQARIDRLLEAAEAHAAIGRLTEPPYSNAYDAYKQVLQIDPNNARARAGILTIEREAKRPRQE